VQVADSQITNRQRASSQTQALAWSESRDTIPA
jgi:hypothetical protein